MTDKSSAKAVILILFEFSDNLSAENSKSSADFSIQLIQLLECMLWRNRFQTQLTSRLLVIVPPSLQRPPNDHPWPPFDIPLTFLGPLTDLPWPPMTSYWPPTTSHWLLMISQNFFNFGPFFFFFPKNLTLRDAHCFWQWASKNILRCPPLKGQAVLVCERRLLLGVCNWFVSFSSCYFKPASPTFMILKSGLIIWGLCNQTYICRKNLL